MDRAVLAFEGVILGTAPPGGRARRSCGDTLDVARSSISSASKALRALAVLGALFGKVRFVLCCEFGCRSESAAGGHSILLRAE